MSAPPTPRCACCTPPFARAHGRRGLLGLAAAGLSAAALPARAGNGTAYDSMLLTCIDPRFIDIVDHWMEGQGLKGKYSRFAIAGASIGVVAPTFERWAPAFWDNLAASIDMHHIKRVIVMNHRDCGAAELAFGAASIASREAETALHRRIFASFQAQLTLRQPKAAFLGGLIGLDGSFDRLAG